jgi:hypothetical protein
MKSQTERLLSELLSEEASLNLSEDAGDLAAFEERAKELNFVFEDVVKDLKRRGKL